MLRVTEQVGASVLLDQCYMLILLCVERKADTWV